MLILQKLFYLLNAHERRRAGFLLCMILAMAILDMASVILIMPFIGLAANPGLIETNATLNYAYEMFNFTSSQQFLIALGGLVFLALLVSLGFKAITTYFQLRFTMMQEYNISRRLVAGYLHQPYSWFLQKNSAALGKNIVSEVNQVINGAAKQIFNLVTNGCTAIVLLLLIIIVEPLLSFSIIFAILVIYGLIYKFVSGFLVRTGVERHRANDARFRLISEAFGAIKEVKLGGLESAYLTRFDEPAKTFALNVATAESISQLPRFALEGVAFGGIMSVVIYLLSQAGDFASAMPTIALFAFAGYRIMPALQGLYAAASQVRFTLPQLNALHADLVSLQEMSPDSSSGKMQLKDEIILSNIKYIYPGAERHALKNFSLSIKARTVVGFVGPTGSGKTTAVDLLLGLLDRDSGTFRVDNQIINYSNRRSWQQNVGYVPQQIYLTDNTIAANIGFGLDENDIDMLVVQRVAKIANLHEFIINSLPDGYQTNVGERGVRLSGGQRQRIGIARALYHDPQVLILDEATSALDNITEQLVMDAVHNLGSDITVILIAHRLSTVQDCDKIFLLVNGQVEDEGTYDNLLQKSNTFRSMTEA